MFIFSIWTVLFAVCLWSDHITIKATLSKDKSSAWKIDWHKFLQIKKKIIFTIKKFNKPVCFLRFLNRTENILKNILVPIDFHSMEKILWKSMAAVNCSFIHSFIHSFIQCTVLIWRNFCCTLFFSACTLGELKVYLSKKVLGNIKYLHGLRLG